LSQVSLINRIDQELTKIRESIAQVQRLLEKVKQTGDQDYIGTIALHLHSFYNGVERIFYGVAKSVDNSVPESEDWHRQLLIQMTLSIPNIRPALIREQTYHELNQFRGFRHVVRSNYAYELEAERVLALAEKLIVANQLFLQDWQQFGDELKSSKQKWDQPSKDENI